jgi:DNA polymerase (family 10)
LKKAVANFISIPQCGRVLASGETKASILLKKSNTQVDLRLVSDYEYGSALLYFTGSKEHNIELRLMAKEKGWKLNEYGLFDEKTEKRLAGNTEDEVYHHLGLQFIPPELRELRGEIKIAMKKKLPELIELQDMKGDMQMHSTWSDGAEEIETIAKYILKEFPQYEYIVMTDHSPSERIAGGLKPAEFRKQFVEIERVNKKIGRDLVKKGVEVDILADGSLDLPDDLLKEFDWVVASIHSGFNKDNTERLLKACEHPSVHCIGHPSGRLIGKREAYPVDWKKLFEKAVATGTAIEINAQPDRLDLKDDLVKDAIEKGVIITISTDSHALTQFDNMTLGVAVARRGWCAKENVLNTGTWKKVEQFKIKKKKG